MKKEKEAKSEMGNRFEVSNGNLKVLETIPRMMLDEDYRKKLRGLVIDFLFNEELIKQRRINQR